MNCASRHRRPRHMSLHTTGMSTTLSRAQRAATVGARLSHPRLHPNLQDLPNRHRTPHQCTAAGESLWSAELHHGKLPLRHDRDVDDLVKKIDELQLRHLLSFLLFENQMHLSSKQWACQTLFGELHPNAPVVATTGMSTLSENCNCGTPQFSARLNPSTVCTQRA